MVTSTVSLQSEARRTLAVMRSSMNNDDVAEYSLQTLVADSSFKLYTAGLGAAELDSPRLVQSSKWGDLSF